MTSTFLTFQARRWPLAAAALSIATALTGCNDSNDASSGPAMAVYLSASPVSGATCTLTDSNKATLATTGSTQNGSGQFGGVGSATGFGLASCSGGTYLDAATGKTLAAPTLRAYTALPGKADAVIVVTPATEIAVRVLGTRAADASYAAVLKRVAAFMGVTGVGLDTVVPTDLASAKASDSAAGRYGVALAAISQLQAQGTLGTTLEQVMASIAANFDSHDYPKDLTPGDDLIEAMDAVIVNPRLAANLGAVGTTLVRNTIDAATDFYPLSVVNYVQADQSPTRSGISHVIDPGVASTLVIGGVGLDPNLDVRLGGMICQVQAPGSLRDESETDDEESIVTCPAQTAGTVQLVIQEAGIVVSQTAISVAVSAKSAARVHALSVIPLVASGTGPATITGLVTAVAPTIGTDPNKSKAAHNYAAPRTFAVKGVVVELLDRGANDTVLLQTSTDAEGRYSFVGADAGKQVVVRVKAQLLKTRAAGATTGAQWNLSVRDNTSTSAVAGTPKALYVIDSAVSTTVAGTQTLNLMATMGFNADGSVQSATGQERQSAPFSILEVAYSAVTKIEVTDPNVAFPDVNIYWSPKNVPSGNKPETGEIGTSKYSSGGSLPGVFILGAADKDTDEFDQGVIGHEFGHWLQASLSYSDSPGGSHAKTQFKDASLAYGEGYGTAVGGLLSDNPLYIDTSGEKQANGGITDLNEKTPAGVRKGFYSEESVGYVMYQIGKTHGFTPFWKAVTALKQGHTSATVFAFVARYIEMNPGLAIKDFLDQENIRSTDALGTLPAGSTPDPAITSAASKSDAPTGADDLETLYLPLTLQPGAAVSAALELAPNAPAFCVNHNLPGAKLSNGLGMLKRFTFKANFTGGLGVKYLNGSNATVNVKSYTISARGDDGVSLPVFYWTAGDGFYFNVKDGLTYTLRFQRDEADVPQGSECNNRLSLARIS